EGHLITYAGEENGYPRKKRRVTLRRTSSTYRWALIMS
ncbi:uncharacterized protein TNIN_102891, partial [Trichonephila inaurata madagascariensis]